MRVFQSEETSTLWIQNPNYSTNLLYSCSFEHNNHINRLTVFSVRMHQRAHMCFNSCETISIRLTFDDAKLTLWKAVGGMVNGAPRDQMLRFHWLSSRKINWNWINKPRQHDMGACEEPVAPGSRSIKAQQRQTGSLGHVRKRELTFWLHSHVRRLTPTLGNTSDVEEK